MAFKENTIILIDSLSGIKNIEDKSIDCILTDPPYGLNKGKIINDETLDTFYTILPECYRVLKKDSFFITFFSTKLLPFVFRHNPFTYHWNYVLYCPLGSVNSPIGYTKYMSCLVFKKGNPKMTKKTKDIFVDTPTRMIEPDEGFIDHPSPKPKTFIKELLLLYTKENDLVFDPFMGSGSTAMACKMIKRRYLGMEIEKKFVELAKNRLNRFNFD